MVSEDIEGFLAYFDMQGFSKLIIKTGFKDKFVDFCKFIEESVNSGGTDIHYRFFSDSVVVYTKEISTTKFVEITATLAQISLKLLTFLDLPVCGGLSGGRFSLHEYGENIIFAGAPMVEAVELEQTQNWFGISVSPNLIEVENSLKTMITFPLRNENIDNLNKYLTIPKLLYYIHKHEEIPIKSEYEDESTISGFIITPQVINPKNPKTASANIWEFYNQLKHLKYRSSSPYIQNKYNNSIDLIGDILIEWEKIEYKAIY